MRGGDSRRPEQSPRGGLIWMCGRMDFFVGQFSGWLGESGQFKTRCVRCVAIRFGLRTPILIIETKESFTGISCSILGLFRISKEGEFRECDLNLERYATNHVAGPMAPLSSSHSTPQSSH